jgi:hypothetical protein
MSGVEERELTGPVDLVDDRGRLRPDAIGWSRLPLHRWAFPAGVDRVHAFDDWCVTTRAVALSVLVADVGLAGVALVSVQDLAGGSPVERVYVRPRGLPVRMPDSTEGELVLDAWRLHLVVGPRRIEAEARTLTGRRIEVALAIERPPGHETVNVVVPWDETRYHFTSKQQALPARGTVRVGKTEHRFDPEGEAFACRDFGRGRWPSGVEWCWAFASARRDGRTIGFNLGSRWTDGTGVTENAVIVDGRVHKIADAVDVTCDRRDRRAPWRIRSRGSARVDLTFTPMTLRNVVVPPLLRLHQCMGRYAGTILDETGAPVVIEDVIGLAESLRGRW